MKSLKETWSMGQNPSSFTFNESQTDWFSGEIAKKLINPKYKIDAAKAPADFDKRVDLKTIETGTIEGVHIKEVKGLISKYSNSSQLTRK